MNSIIRLLSASLILTSSGILAESTNLGIGIGISQQPYKQYHNEISFLPVIDYDHQRFWFRGIGGGYKLWSEEKNQVSLIGFWSPLWFRPSESNDNSLRLLDKRRSTIMAGIDWNHETDFGSFYSQLAKDILNNSQSTTADVSWRYTFIGDYFSFTPAIGTMWNSNAHNRYYYGVSARESNISGLGRYKPGSSLEPYLEMSATYRLLSDWHIFLTSRYSHFSSEVKDSPMVGRSWVTLMSTGVIYTF